MNLYKSILKPIFFRIDPETVHNRVLFFGRILGSNFVTRLLVKKLFSYSHPSLNQTFLGMSFPNPVGLSAGFDKEAQLTNIIPAVGFGFIEVGSITGEPCEGNPRPRLWRIPDKKSLVVFYGLKNRGAKIISKKFKKANIPTGVSIAKTNCESTVDTMKGINDYFKAYSLLKDKGDYVTINISCPNTFGGEPFTDPVKLDLLLKKFFSISKLKPIFLKISPDISNELLDELFNVSRRYEVDGFICSNLTKKRPDGFTKGGVSGKIVKPYADAQLKYLYKKNKKENTNFLLIGCGGISSAEDAYEKIKNGASLLQLITGMIFEGPQLIGKINKDLVKLLEKDGYSNISEAIGKNF